MVSGLFLLQKGSHALCFTLPLTNRYTEATEANTAAHCDPSQAWLLGQGKRIAQSDEQLTHKKSLKVYPDVSSSQWETGKIEQNSKGHLHLSFYLLSTFSDNQARIVSRVRKAGERLTFSQQFSYTDASRKL